MSFYSKKAIAALDFGFDSAIVLLVEKGKQDSLQVIGAGESKLQGPSGTGIFHLGDAVEAVVSAVHRAENSAGAGAEKIYFNFDDPEIESLKVRAARKITGEGEIRPSDVREAQKTALRMSARFEKTVVYAKETGFLIDDHDAVADPIGIFGQKIETELHIFQARAEYYEAWQKLLQRAGFEKNVPILSAHSTALGVLLPEERRKKKLIVDLGKDLCTAFVFFRDTIFDFCVISGEETASRLKETVSGLGASHPDTEEILITGDQASEEIKIFLESSERLPVRIAVPIGASRLAQPKYASIVGLLHAAQEIEKKNLFSPRDKRLILNAKEKAISFINEYF